MTVAARPPVALRRRRRFAIVFAGMFGGLALLPALPWVMGIVTDVRHSYTAEVPAANKGVYLVTDDGAMQLYKWSIDPGVFPPDAPTLVSSRIRTITLVQRHFVEPREYLLYDLDRARTLPWQDVHLADKRLTLDPGPLLAGRYVLMAPTDSSFGGVTRHFFAVS